jgi:hypothetical protein
MPGGVCCNVTKRQQEVKKTGYHRDLPASPVTAPPRSTSIIQRRVKPTSPKNAITALLPFYNSSRPTGFPRSIRNAQPAEALHHLP